jgi:uncharacterized protein (TIGR02996 family)
VIAELFAAVYADPDDDEPRRVLGDHLIDVGDPRGELILLQLARGRKGYASTRELELLERHAADWLGPLGAVVGYGASCTTRFERGFLAEASIIRDTKKVLRALAGEPGWSTVERFSYGVPPQLLDRAPFRALRAISVNKGQFGRLARRKVAFASVVEVELLTSIGAGELARVFPRVHALRIRHVPDADELAKLAAIGCRELAIARHLTYDGDAYDDFDDVRELRELVADMLAAPSPFERFYVGDERYQRDERGYLVRY